MSANPTPDQQSKAWTSEQLRDFIKATCGEVVAQALKPLQDNITENGKALGELKGNASAAPVNKVKGILFGAMVSAMAATKCDVPAAVKYAKDHGLGDEVAKALEASTGSAGGFLLPTEVSTDFIDLLRPRTVMRSMGVPTVNIGSGALQIPSLTASASAYYVGENREIPVSQPEFGMLQLGAKKLGVLVPISNSLLRRGGSGVSTLVRNDALRAAQIKEDVTFIRSQGGEYTPRGLRSFVLPANLLDGSGVSESLADVTTFFGQMILALEEANVPMTNPGWIFSPRTRMFLMNLRDGNGNFAFRQELMAGNFWGYPYRVTTQIPRNLGGGGNATEIYLADFDDVIIGETAAVEIAMSTEAAYRNEQGNVVSAYQLDQTVMRIIMEHDFGVRRRESVVVAEGITWA